MQRALKVFVDLTQFWPGGQSGGIKPALLQTIQWLGKLGENSLSLVVLSKPDFESEIAVRLRETDKLIVLTDATPRDVAAQEQCDVVYCPFGSTEWACPGLPTITLIVDLIHRDFPATLDLPTIRHRENQFCETLQRTDLFQVISHHTAERLRFHGDVPPDRMVLTYHAVHDRLPATTRPAPISTPYFFYPANPWKHKNHRMLIEAYATYREAAGANPWDLVLTGHDNAATVELRHFAFNLGISTHIHFLGYVTEEILSSLWQNAKVLVFPSLHEGFGIPLVEAMSYRVPIIASRATAIPEIVGDGALLLEGNDPLVWSSALLQIFQNPQLRDELAARGSRRMASFSPSHEFSQLLTALRSAASLPASRWGHAGYHHIDGLVEPLAMFALPPQSKSLKLVSSPMGVARRIQLWCGSKLLCENIIDATSETTIQAQIPALSRVLTLRVLDASRLSITDPRIHGILLKELAAIGLNGKPVQLLK